MENNLILSIEQSSNNYYKLKNKKKYIKIKINNILSPFGIDEEYGNYVMKFEIDQFKEEHINVINQIKDIEFKLKYQNNNVDKSNN